MERERVIEFFSGLKLRRIQVENNVLKKTRTEADRAATSRDRDERQMVTCRGAALGDREAPDRVVIVPWGEVESTAGAFVVDEESGRLAVEAFESHGADLPIDFEHQTLGGDFSAPSGRAPAAGWIVSLEAIENEGLVAKVNWTEEGSRLIGERAYRYLSPVALIRRDDRKLVALHSAALTNKPAIVGMAALVNRDAAEEPIRADACRDLCQILSLSQSSSVDMVLSAAAQRIRSLEAHETRRAAEALVESAMSAGKLTEAQRSWATAMAVDHPDRFEEWVATAPVVLSMGRSTSPSPVALSAAGAANRARAEHRSSPLLQQLTSEEAYVAQAMAESNGSLRQASCGRDN